MKKIKITPALILAIGILVAGVISLVRVIFF
jgi:preprotein translocase subunit Sec61beta